MGLKDWRAPDGWTRIRTIDLHTAGEPFRVVVDGVPELVESTVNGISIGPADDIALARELRTLSADPDRLCQMGARGRQRFETNHRFEEFLERTWRQYGEEASGWPTSIASF